MNKVLLTLGFIGNAVLYAAPATYQFAGITSLAMNVNNASGVGSVPAAPNGTIDGAQFNWVGLGLVDPTGTAFNGSALPANPNFASFQNPFCRIQLRDADQSFGSELATGSTNTLKENVDQCLV